MTSLLRSARRHTATWSRVLGLVALVTLSSAAPAWAQDDGAKAAALAREAEDLMRDKKYDLACAKLDESFVLDPRGTTALDLAICREKQGKIGRAYRYYGIAADLAEKEGRNDRVMTAKAARQKLFFRIPKLKVKVGPDVQVAGLTIKVDGEVVPDAAYNNEWEVDAGTLTVTASAPGRKSWEKTIKVTERARVSVTIVPLAIDDNPQPVPAPTPTPVGAPAPNEEPVPEQVPEEPEDDGPNEHSSNRIVVEVGAIGGLMFHDIERGTLNELVGTTYFYEVSGEGLRQATCGDTETIPGAGDCEATFNSKLGGLVGGQVFVGWALADIFHLGVRGFGGAHFPTGFWFAGGPSFSVRAVGPLWLGASFVLGLSEHRATVASASGTIPPEDQPKNDNATTANIPLQDLDFQEGKVLSGLLMGGSVEIGISLVGPSPYAIAPVGKAGGFFSGAMMLSLFPTVQFTGDGYALAIPAGISYRFH
ncbi:MAG: hypothetical protein R3B72_16430 [Polyangiaceae bacterium]